MSNSKETVHPFFQPRKTQKANSPPIASPEDTNSELKRESKKPILKKKINLTPVTTPSPPSAPFIKTRQQQPQNYVSTFSSKYVKKGECSTPCYIPIAKPKFYSDTVEYQKQVDYETSFNFNGKISSPKKKQKNDHEFSRMNRRIFGHGHITDKKYEVDSSILNKHPAITKLDLQQYIEDNQHKFFQQRKHLREDGKNKNKNKINCNGDIKMSSTVSNQDELEALLNVYFPNWQTFSSCVLLMQTIFDKKRHTDNSNKQWIDKYRPHHLNGLLGERHNFRYLKDWLHQMKIEPLSAPTLSTDKSKKRRKKKHKKLVMQHDEDFEDEDAFLRNLSLYEDENDDDFTMKPVNRKELKKESMRSNIILLVGDHGIGKTASIYTIAEQMDYEVFEINAGSRRSGKDIMSAVGEMTKSHLVTFGIAPPTSVSSLFLEKPCSNSIATKTSKKKKLSPSLRSSFSSATASKTSLKDFLVKKKPSATTTTTTTTTLPSTITPPTTKQSLILLEEVDILFEEDKGFWASVVELSQNSKRPIIMTCNEPEQIPIENMSLQVIIDMKPPTENELLAYLWLICFSEGYTVAPVDLLCLVAFLGRDIRQLIQTLELYAGQGIFGHYLGINKNMDTLETRSRCVPSKIAIDTFRLARSYQRLEGYVKKEEPDELNDIERILENNAFIDTWLGWKENGTMIQESVQDQLNGYTTLWVEDDEDSLYKHINKEIECITTVLNNSSIDWVMDEDSHWDELCDARSSHFDDYKEAIENLLPLRQQYQPNDQIIMMEYVPYIRQMIVPIERPSKTRTRSKRKRLHLPLKEDSVEILTNHKPPVDETQVHIQILVELFKDQ